ncbi:hypothetical protein FLM9_672 [Candidatus Synechococcus spongiarum]|uniref:Transmembrane protein n=2 Tax=Candidatus Synechococcus spongiarum TaxID=431041 RepID=A0A170T7D6_9SYNE|nr:hypothetical protein FLM9_672 [Candidatus Synechococcus spongiarum]
MTTAEATLGTGSFDEAIRALGGYVMEAVPRRLSSFVTWRKRWTLAQRELKSFVKRRKRRKRWKLAQRGLKSVVLVFLVLFVSFQLFLLFLAGIAARHQTQQLARCMNQETFDGDEGLALLKTIAKHCGDQVRKLDDSYRQLTRLKLLRWSPLNGVVMDQLDTLICELEDVGETAALSASPEVTATIMEQLAAHGIA